jgi:hypothetical protein
MTERLSEMAFACAARPCNQYGNLLIDEAPREKGAATLFSLFPITHLVIPCL